MPYSCEIKEQPAQPVLSIRTFTSVHQLPEVLGKAFDAVLQYLGELGEPPAGAPFAAYFNMDMQNLDMEIGFPVAKSLPGKGDVQASQIPGGMVATCLYTGPYNGLALAYGALTQHIQEAGFTPSGVAYEMYLNDPTQTPPQELQTLILFPIASA